MNKKLRSTALCFLVICKIYAQPNISLEIFATGFDDPVDITNAGDDRMFIVERKGYIKITDMLGNVYPDDFLDIHLQIEDGYQEQGLLGLAFHPNYAVNGYFFVNYIDLDGNTVVSRFTKSTFDDDIADPTTELIIFTAVQPFVNHNGGCLKFGPDGYLYIGLGDGGDAGDPGDRAQNPENKLGKMHRIDIDGGTPYAIPADNPFAITTDTLPEIWAIGYRNPWRYSFDEVTGDFWVADVGQNQREEIDVEPAGSGGHNYGWRCYEGFSEFNTDDCAADSTYVFPILDYPHNYTTGGFAITGGFVYRGDAYPGMYGYYVCADYVSGNWWWVAADLGLPWFYGRMDDIQEDISCFGTDMNSELYCGDLSSGIIYKVKDDCGDFLISATVIDYTCGLDNGSADLTITSGAAPFDIEWSNGATTEDIIGLVPGIYSVVVIDDNGCERSTFVTVNELPAFEAGITVSGNVLTANTGVEWQWYLDGVEISGATEMSYTATADGSYTVLITDINDCSDISEAVDFQVAVDHFNFLSSINLFPDPANDNINVEIYATQNMNGSFCAIINELGEKIMEQKINIHPGKNNITLETQDLKSGFYYIRIIGIGGLMNRGFIISH
ncbi:MAG: PQQ-dependent sugar dehydrogenase [Chitinophagales bacterium]